jgi:pSer/pThr/pTyr-binding forkhead associated (FHA) protein
MEAMVSPSLVVISGSARERRIPVPAHGLVLGRDGQLGVPFSTDQFVSRNHVALRRRDNSCVEIADLGSENGTYLNGTQVRDQARMHGGDVLRIGEIELKLDLLPSPAMSFDATIAAGLNDEETPVPRLVIVTPDAYSGRQIRLPGEYMVVGREPTSDICLDDPHVSRTHAALRRHGDAVYVQDLGSSAGTFVNGTAVTNVQQLRPGDLVTFAGVQAGVQARFEPAGAGPAAARPAEPAIAWGLAEPGCRHNH